MQPAELLIGCLVFGTLSMAQFLSFWHGAERPSERWVARMAIHLGAPNLPVLLLPSSLAWYAYVAFRLDHGAFAWPLVIMATVALVAYVWRD